MHIVMRYIDIQRSFSGNRGESRPSSIPVRGSEGDNEITYCDLSAVLLSGRRLHHYAP